MFAFHRENVLMDPFQIVTTHDKLSVEVIIPASQGTKAECVMITLNYEQTVECVLRLIRII